jgi:OOP family OmpA-OmpF porin
MKKISFLCMLFVANQLMAQPVQNASIPKDAPVDVMITDFKDNPLPNEIMIFRSKNKDREFQGMTNDQGKFSTRLPSGDVYNIFIMGFKDSTSIDSLVIPALEGNKYYKNPFIVTYQFQPAKSFVLENCNFDNGKSTLQESAYPVLDELVAYMKRKDDDRIELGGHTDNVGNPASNLKLSQDRANTVRDYLVEKGIDPNRIVTKGYGHTKPISKNNTAEGRAENRRTEVTILE